MELSRWEYKSGKPLRFRGDRPDPGIKPRSPALAGRFFTIWATKEAYLQREEKMNKLFGQPNVYPLHTPCFNSDCMCLSKIYISNKMVKISENIREVLGKI